MRILGEEYDEYYGFAWDQEEAWDPFEGSEPDYPERYEE